jgi:hypothetical protein
VLHGRAHFHKLLKELFPQYSRHSQVGTLMTWKSINYIQV